MSLRRVGAGTAFLVAGAFFSSAHAAPVTGGAGTKTLIDPSAMIQKTQVIVFGGRRWCYYWDAWNGPGWYWCGYGWRRGFGWGGGPGWHGWRYESRNWHRRNRGWDRADRRRWDRGDRRRVERRWDGDRRGRSVERGTRSERRSFDRGRSGSREGMSRGRSGGDRGFSGRSGGRESFGGRSGGRSDGGRGASGGRSGGGDGGRGSRGGRG